eukprot:TRINITY_DN5629_c0_g1_i1.p1 TRINITY_DN5629_c0_g1~~TRINITY_DN5629_c0_g1_i1.p1  ORF type:complete len:423 (-),score=101.11 TRINITY_DN5629_c0_g1_i1:68-1336(-)
MSNIKLHIICTHEKTDSFLDINNIDAIDNTEENIYLLFRKNENKWQISDKNQTILIEECTTFNILRVHSKQCQCTQYTKGLIDIQCLDQLTTDFKKLEIKDDPFNWNLVDFNDNSFKLNRDSLIKVNPKLIFFPNVESLILPPFCINDQRNVVLCIGISEQKQMSIPLKLISEKSFIDERTLILELEADNKMPVRSNIPFHLKEYFNMEKMIFRKNAGKKKLFFPRFEIIKSFDTFKFIIPRNGIGNHCFTISFDQTKIDYFQIEHNFFFYELLDKLQKLMFSNTKSLLMYVNYNANFKFLNFEFYEISPLITTDIIDKLYELSEQTVEHEFILPMTDDEKKQTFQIIKYFESHQTLQFIFKQDRNLPRNIGRFLKSYDMVDPQYMNPFKIYLSETQINDEIMMINALFFDNKDYKRIPKYS